MAEKAGSSGMNAQPANELVFRSRFPQVAQEWARVADVVFANK